MPGLLVAVASAVLMISRRHVSTEMARTIVTHHMGWYSTSGTLRVRPESTVTATNGDPANVQGRGRSHPTKDGSEGGAKAGTLGGGTGPRAATVTVTDFVTDGAKSHCKTRRFRLGFLTAHSAHSRS